MPSSPPLPLPMRRSARPLAAGLRALAGRLWRWYDLFRQRRALARLDERMLRDIGITRLDARREALRPFWDEPREWRR